jgi:PIN domain nuclease of toxin-antitoxin system
VVVVADSHAVVWYLSGSSRLSAAAKVVLEDAEASEGLVVSIASLIDLWYVSQSTGRVSAAALAELRRHLASSAAVRLEPVSLTVADASMSIPRTLLPDPWDRLIVATAMALEIALVTADGPIRKSGLVETIW